MRTLNADKPIHVAIIVEGKHICTDHFANVFHFAQWLDMGWKRKSYKQPGHITVNKGNTTLLISENQ